MLAGDRSLRWESAVEDLAGSANGLPARRLVGVGVGPGEANLITLKAVDVLRSADVILVPSTERSGTGPGRAESIVLEVCPELRERIRRVPFSMADRQGVSPRRAEAWQVSAAAVLEAFDEGAQLVCLATVGDPSVYSTFSYLAAEVEKALPQLLTEVVPGITAMQALAAASRTALTEGTEVLALVPVTAGMGTVERVLEVADTVVLYKAGRQMSAVVEVVRAKRPDDVGLVGTEIGLPDQSIRPLAEVPESETAPYFSTVLVAPVRPTTGGRL